VRAIVIQWSVKPDDPLRYWIDPGLPDPLHMLEDVKDPFERVAAIQEKLLAEAIRKASRN
jgi:hypothetical protein